MQMNYQERMEQTCNYLRIIERTRLLCNTTDELSLIVGFSISGNGLIRKGGKSLFLKDAIFRELAQIAKERADIDLQDTVENYIEADCFFSKYGKSIKGETTCHNLIKYYYADGEATEDISLIVKKLETKHIPILILIILGVLPKLSAKDGDVKNIKDDYQIVFKLLRNTVCNNIPTHSLPALEQMESCVKSDKNIMCRIHIIYTITSILSAYSLVSTQNNIFLSNRETLEKAYTPDIEGIWIEDEYSTMFWYIEDISNGFNLYKYTLNNEKHELSYIKYYLSFYKVEGEIIAMIIHPDSTKYILNNKPTPNYMFSYFECEMSENEISFFPIAENDKRMGLRHLRKSDMCEQYKRILNNERYLKINIYADEAYNFTISLAAITEDYIYIENTENCYYKIPKSLNDNLYDVSFKEKIGVVEYNNKTYIALDDRSIYWDVTTEDNRKALGIEVVEEIVLQHEEREP